MEPTQTQLIHTKVVFATVWKAHFTSDHQNIFTEHFKSNFENGTGGIHLQTFSTVWNAVFKLNQKQAEINQQSFWRRESKMRSSYILGF